MLPDRPADLMHRVQAEIGRPADLAIPVAEEQVLAGNGLGDNGLDPVSPAGLNGYL